MLRSVDSWPVSPDHVAGSGIDPLSSSTFWNYPLTSYYFSNDRRLKYNFLKCMLNKLCSWAAPLKFWFQTDLGVADAKIQPAFTCRESSRFWLFAPWLSVGHALRLIFMLWLVKIWQVSSCRKCMQHLETCFLIVEGDRVLCRQLVMFLTVFFLWMYKMNTTAIKILL